jgi:hypothetical protein
MTRTTETVNGKRGTQEIYRGRAIETTCEACRDYFTWCEEVVSHEAFGVIKCPLPFAKPPFTWPNTISRWNAITSPLLQWLPNCTYSDPRMRWNADSIYHAGGSNVLKKRLTHWHARARSTSRGQTNHTSFYPMIALVISLLPCHKHHIRFPRTTQSSNAKLARNPFPFLKLDIISRDNMGKQGLDFIDSKEPSGTDSKLGQGS